MRFNTTAQQPKVEVLSADGRNCFQAAHLQPLAEWALAAAQVQVRPQRRAAGRLLGQRESHHQPLAGVGLGLDVDR